MPQISQPAAPVIPPPPPKEEAVKEEEKKKLTKGREKRSTLLTGPRGILEPAPVGYKTLLGE